MKHFILVLNLITTFKPPTKQKTVIHINVKISQHLPMTDLMQWHKKQKGVKKRGVPGMPFFSLHSPISHNLMDVSSDVLCQLYSSGQLE